MTTRDLMVEAQKVRKSFGRLEVLKGIDMRVPRGTVTYLIGPSGSGKSTLLRYTNHLERINTGRLYVDGSPIGYREKSSSLYETSAAEAVCQRRDIGMVFQNFNLFPHRTMLGNITEAPVLAKGASQEQAEKRAMELLETVGLAHKADAYPVQLSGGQQQRVTVMRTLAMELELMLFDEPTSAFGPELVDGILSVMCGLADKGMTMIVVAHEMGFTREVTDRVAFMTDGIVMEKGTPDEVLGNLKHERIHNLLSSLLK